MQDRPSPAELVQIVAKLLRDDIAPLCRDRKAFEVRVAINALDLVSRQLTLAESAHALEKERLAAFVEENGSLDEMNRGLCEEIRQGAIAGDDPELLRHLWLTTMEKLAVDQPNYASYLAELETTEETPP
jgi:Domain of unknown function (DUF6285)